MSKQSSKRWAIRTSRTFLSTIAAAPLLATLPLYAQPVVAGQSDYQDNKVTICHRTNSASNPYVEVTMSTNAYDGNRGNSTKSDHLGEHQGPKVSSYSEAKQLKSQKIKWGDYNVIESGNGECDIALTKPVKPEKPVKDEKPGKDDCDDKPGVVKDDNQTPPVATQKPVTPTPAVNQPVQPQVLSTIKENPNILAETGNSTIATSSLMSLLVIMSTLVLYKFTKNPVNDSEAIEAITI